ncbi:MAG: PD-(D/E)XK nuclease superfamily protein [Actinomycetota bacterium]
MTQGSRANKSGYVLELAIEGALKAHGYVEISGDLPKKSRRQWLLYSTELTKRYAKQVFVGRNIYKTDIYVDFYIFNSISLPDGLIIECKWQESRGTVDEKYPYLNLNIKSSYPAPTIVVIGGRGVRQGAIDWFNQQIEDNPNLLAVYKLENFLAWANNHL